MATFQVPAWFNIEADSAQEAWDRIEIALRQVVDTMYEREPALNDFVVEEPTFISED